LDFPPAPRARQPTHRRIAANGGARPARPRQHRSRHDRRSIFLAAAAGLQLFLRSSMARPKTRILSWQTVTIIHSDRPGGAYDAYARLNRPPSRQTSPANPTILATCRAPAASSHSTISTERRGPQDGHRSKIITSSLCNEQAVRQPADQIDARKFLAAAACSTRPRAVLCWHASPIRRWQDNADKPSTIAIRDPTTRIPA